VQLTHFDGPLAGTPRWSPDGRQIAFDSRASNIPAIYVISAEGGTPRKITTGVAGNMVPGWSRDGKCVYYSSIRNGITNVWKMPVAGGPEQQVTTNGGIYAAESFDGKYVYYSRSQTDPTLWRVAVGGGEEEAVVGAPKPVDCSHWALGASGIYIVDANADLIFYDFAHRHSNKVTHQPEFLTDWSLALSSDGSEVLWAQIDARAADLMLVENFH
jgi:dipeptidyl aminopeptidase/acylaminoacyl peptidase